MGSGAADTSGVAVASGGTVVTGAAGQVGRQLVACGATPVFREQLDLDAPVDRLRQSALRLFEGARTVVNCAAYTDVDGAESPANRDLVESVNAVAPGVLAAAAAEVGARFVHVSTDYVFPGVPAEPGREWQVDDRVRPLNEYGRTKALGEDAARAYGGTVVRTAWVWSGPGSPGRDFVTTMAGLARGGVDPRVVDDQTGRPTFATDLAAGLWTLSRLPGDLPPVLHFTDAGDPVTWFGVAREVFRILGEDPDRVSACSSDEWQSPAQRPAWSVLDLSTWRATVGEPPQWKESLRHGLSGVPVPGAASADND